MFKIFVWSFHDGRILHDRAFRTEAEAHDFISSLEDDPAMFTEWYEDGTPQHLLGLAFIPEEALGVLVASPDLEEGEKTDEN